MSNITINKYRSKSDPDGWGRSYLGNVYWEVYWSKLPFGTEYYGEEDHQGWSQFKSETEAVKYAKQLCDFYPNSPIIKLEEGTLQD